MTYLPFAKPTIDEETIAGVAEVLRSGWITTGPKVKAFEQALSDYLGGRIVRTFTSATGALEVALQACGIGPGDEVIVPAMTFAASANVVMRVGARPVFVDVELDSRNLDLDQVEAAITPRTRAIMPVHFAGLAMDMDRLYAIARRRGVRVVEDAAHAIGTAWRGQRIGSFGDLVSFSFHPNKNMTTIEGGALSLPSSPSATTTSRSTRFAGQTSPTCSISNAISRATACRSSSSSSSRTTGRTATSSMPRMRSSSTIRRGSARTCGRATTRASPYAHSRRLRTWTRRPSSSM